METKYTYVTHTASKNLKWCAQLFKTLCRDAQKSYPQWDFIQKTIVTEAPCIDLPRSIDTTPVAQCLAYDTDGHIMLTITLLLNKYFYIYEGHDEWSIEIISYRENKKPYIMFSNELPEDCWYPLSEYLSTKEEWNHMWNKTDCALDDLIKKTKKKKKAKANIF